MRIRSCRHRKEKHCYEEADLRATVCLVRRIPILVLLVIA